MRIVFAIALVASLLAGCGPSLSPDWVGKTWEDSASVSKG
jgi:hypothetical protein